MNCLSETTDKFLWNINGVLKLTPRVVEWTVSPTQMCRARSGVFSTLSELPAGRKLGVNCLVLVNESDLPENIKRLNVWFYTRAVVEHTLEISFSLLDDKNRQCYAVDKRLSSSVSETRKACVTVDFSIIPHPPQKFFHNGALRIRCSICVDIPESVSPSLDLSSEESNNLGPLLQKHLENMVKDGVLTEKDVFTWTIQENIMRTGEVKVRSNSFECASSKFFLSLSGRFRVCLTRKTEVFLHRKLRVTLAVLDNKGLLHHAKEYVTEGPSEVFLECGRVLENPGKFLTKGELKIYCSLQAASDNLALTPGISSGTSKMTTASSPNENLADADEACSSDASRANELTPLPVNKLQILNLPSQVWKSPRSSAQKLMVENSILFSSKEEDKSEIEESLNEMLQLLHDASVDRVLVVFNKNTVRN